MSTYEGLSECDRKGSMSLGIQRTGSVSEHDLEGKGELKEAGGEVCVLLLGCQGPKISGGDAPGGHTRSHPEHDG